jgi:uncharacterized repeat protein (TIGR03803 family)
MRSAGTNCGTTDRLHISDVRPRLRTAKPASTAINGALALAVLSALLLITARPARAQTETVLYNFCSLRGTCPDGADPISRLTADGAGNFYGTTHAGSSRDGSYGDVFELSPNGNGGWNETVLYAFTEGTDGGYPQFSPVVFDNLGNLYGTTQDGGVYGQGVVFELHPIGTSWTETVLYSFAGTGDGSGPDTGVIIDAAGNLYGATAQGGPGNVGTVFELSHSGGNWMEQVIYTFDSSLYFPPSGLMMDGGGNIFGAANLTVLELSPNGSGWIPTVLHTFPGPYLGIEGTPALDAAGNIYGTIMRENEDGTMGPGQVYKLKQKDGQWTIQILQTWKDGFGPYYAGVVLDAAGNIYGTTIGGGTTGQGTVFELLATKKAYQPKVLWSFNGTGGAQPASSLLLDDAGNLYGTAEFGGSIGYGTIFEVTPHRTSAQGQ